MIHFLLDLNLYSLKKLFPKTVMEKVPSRHNIIKCGLFLQQIYMFFQFKIILKTILQIWSWQVF